MMSRSDIHCHSAFSDGSDTMEDMVLAAIDRGFASIGFSEHGWASYDFECCIKKENIPAYFAEADRLRRKYAGKIELYAGFESDYFFPAPKEGQDFSIGSVHYLYDGAAGAYYTVDYRPEMFEAARDRIAGGDVRRMVEIYYGQVADMAETYRPDIIGHLDLISKLNAGNRYFDETGAWYREIVAAACKRIAAAGCIVEINSGGVCRGYRDRPYPARWILELLRGLGAPVILASDAHSAEALGFWFDRSAELLRDIGYGSVKQLVGGRFVDVAL